MKDLSKGLTLIEVLVSIVLVGVIAVFIAIAIPTSANLSNRTDKMETTAVLAQKYIEDVKSALRDDSTMFDDMVNGTTPPLEVDEEYTNSGDYSLETSLTVENTADVDDDGVEEPTLVSLTVTVSPAADEAEGATTTEATTSNQTVNITTLLRRDRTIN